jgi:DNA-binding response OmpR family regulator
MNPRVLLVDDDSTLLNLLGRFLREQRFEVFEAANGTIGIRLAHQERPDLILLDVMLPGMDGWETCARLREMSNVPIIMLTAKATEADKLRGFRLGVDDYVTKPFSFAELAARIQAVLARAESVNRKGPGEFAYGGITLDMERYQAALDGRNLELTPTEFRLLEALVRRAGKVAMDSELIQEVWGAYRPDDTGLVRRYILMLRKKIETDPSKPVRILTVRGFGYRLESPDLTK